MSLLDHELKNRNRDPKKQQINDIENQTKNAFCAEADGYDGPAPAHEYQPNPYGL